jgi:DNA-binding FrmR family transcriptional regulator
MFIKSFLKGRKTIKHKTPHSENLIALKRIEGQVKGIQKMVEEGKYCIDIIVQIRASIGGLYSVSEKILTKHIEHCVVDAFRGKSKKDKDEKIQEITDVIHNLNKLR